MMRSLGRWWNPSPLDQFLQRRRAQRHEGTLTSSSSRDCTRVVLAEMMAAAAALDFGGFPFEMPVGCDIRRDESDD
jgi:hypothetical protein